MPHNISGGRVQDTGHSDKQKLEKGIMITDVLVKKREIIVDIPKVNLIEKTYEKPIIKEVEYIKPKIVEKEVETLRYVPVERTTIKYVATNVECEKPIIKEKIYEKPVIEEKKYIQPVITRKEIEVVSIKDIGIVKEYIELAQKLSLVVPELIEQMKELKNIKLVEKIVEVPKIQWINTPVERIIWKDVERPNERKGR